MRENFIVLVFFFTGLLNIHSQLHEIQIEIENMKIDKNIIGIPTEQYGFSNNVSGILSIPLFKNVSFNLIKDIKLKITLK